MQRRFLLFGVLAFSALQLFAQQREIDSLKIALDKTNDLSTKVDVLCDLSSAYFDYDSDKAYEYASSAFDLSNELNDPQRMRRSLTLKGYFYYVKGSYTEALGYFNEAADVPLEPEKYYGYNQVMIGTLYRVRGEYDSAETAYRSAEQVLKKANAQPLLAYTYRNMARLYLTQWKNDEAKQMLRQAQRIYARLPALKGLGDTWILFSQLDAYLDYYDSAEIHLARGCELADQARDEFLQLSCRVERGNLEFRLGKYPEALKMYIEALGNLKSKDLPLLVCRVYIDIGDIYRAMSDNPIALRYYEEGLKVANRLNLPYEKARIFGNLASVYRSYGELNKARDYVERSLAIRTKIHDRHGIALCNSLLGQLSQLAGRLDESEKFLAKSFEIRKEINHREGMASSLYNMSMVYAARKDFAKTVDLQKQALAIETTVGNRYTMGFSNNRLGELYTRLGQFDIARNYLKKAENYARETKSRTLTMNNELYWSGYYEAKGDRANALDHFKRYNAVHDSVHNDIAAQKLAELQALYMMEKKDQEIALLNQQRLNQENELQLQRSRIDQQNIIIISGIIGFLMVSLVAYLSYKYSNKIAKANREITEQKEEIQAQSEELIDANQTIAEINKKLESKIEERTVALSQAYKELDTFFYRSSHDFRRPLTTFLGLAEVAKVTVRDQNALELFEKVRETAIYLDKMLVKLQSISDVGSQQLVYKEIFIKDIFDAVCDTFRDEIQKRNIKTAIDIRIHDTFVSYPAMIKTILENLTENAILFCGTHDPFIKLTAVQTGDYVTIEIHDNGQGIAPEYHEQIFDMYYRANEKSKGNGLGLYIVRKAVEKLDGSITMSSIPGVGSTFTVMLPRAYRF